jgi:hypothetical protein
MALGLLATWTLAMWNGDGWVAEMRQGIVPWVSIAVTGEVFHRLKHRKRAGTTNP